MNALRWCIVVLVLLQGVIAVRQYPRTSKYSYPYSYKYPQRSYKTAPRTHRVTAPKQAQHYAVRQQPSDDTYLHDEIKRMTSMIENCYFPTGGFVCKILDGRELRLQCIPSSRVCDGEVDCPLGDDENDCPIPPITGTGPTNSQLCCLNGTYATVCDTITECPDGVDERSCQSAAMCPAGQIKCAKGVCATMCDGSAECSDKFEDAIDENQCRYNFPSGMPCNIEPEYICDGVVDCKEGLDEQNCYLTCEVGELGCLDTDGEKICATLCDGVNECNSNADERGQYCGTCFDNPCYKRNAP